MHREEKDGTEHRDRSTCHLTKGQERTCERMCATGDEGQYEGSVMRGQFTSKIQELGRETDLFTEQGKEDRGQKQAA